VRGPDAVTVHDPGRDVLDHGRGSVYARPSA
jgi:hypothetical protein